MRTRRQLALAGFIYEQSKCSCPQCGVKIELNHIDENFEYESNYYRKLHRKEVAHLGKRCSFLLCESGTNIDDIYRPSLSLEQQSQQWDDAEIPEYAQYTKRVESFDSWPCLKQDINEKQNTFISPETMAKHGFYFSGSIYFR